MFEVQAHSDVQDAENTEEDNRRKRWRIDLSCLGSAGRLGVRTILKILPGRPTKLTLVACFRAVAKKLTRRHKDAKARRRHQNPAYNPSSLPFFVPLSLRAFVLMGFNPTHHPHAVTALCKLLRPLRKVSDGYFVMPYLRSASWAGQQCRLPLVAPRSYNAKALGSLRSRVEWGFAADSKLPVSFDAATGQAPS